MSSTKPVQTAEKPPETALEIFDITDDELMDELVNLDDEIVKDAIVQKAPVLDPVVPEALVSQPIQPEPSKIQIDPAEGILLDTQDVLDGAMMTREECPIQKYDELEEEEEQQQESKSVLSTLAANYKLVLGGLVLATVGVLMIPSSKVSNSTVQSAKQSPMQPGADVVGGASQTPVVPGQEVAGPALDIASMGASPDDQQRLSAEMDKDFHVIPPAEQTCSNPALTSYDQRQCSRFTAQRFYQCTEGVGRRWNVSIPGCEQI